MILNENAQLCFVPFTKESDVKYAKVTGGLGRFILKGNTINQLRLKSERFHLQCSTGESSEICKVFRKNEGDFRFRFS